MSRTRSLLVAAATLLSVVSPFVSPVAHATVPSPTLVYAADLDNDGVFGLYRATVDAPETRTAVLADNGSLDVARALLSPDGSRIAALVDFRASTDAAGDYSLVTMNLDGSNRRLIVAGDTNSTASSTTTDFVSGFSWTPDSTKLVFGWEHEQVAPTFNFSSVVREESAVGGTATTLSGSSGLTDIALSPDGTELAAVNEIEIPAPLVVAPMSNLASQTSLASGASPPISPAWSPDGTAIAFVTDDSDNGTANHPLDATEIDVTRFDSGTSTWSQPSAAYGPVKSLSASWVAEDPFWSDNTTILFDQFDDTSNATNPPQHLQSITFTTSWSAPTDLTPSDGAALASPATAPADTTPPSGPIVFSAFTLAGTSLILHWTPPADADYSHVTLHRGGPGGAVDIPNVFGTSYTDHNLSLGGFYTYTATVYDGAGNAGPDSAVHGAIAQPFPKISAYSPTLLGTAGLSFKVQWAYSQDPINPPTYDVRYAVKGGSSWTLGAPVPWLTGTTNLTATFNPSPRVGGQTYYFQVIMHDGQGNSGATSWHGFNVALNQNAGLYSRGWKTVSYSKAGWWLGDIAVTGVNGTSVTFSPVSRNIEIIGDRCAACGSFRVYVGGVLKATVSEHARSTMVRQVLWTANYSTIAKRTVKIVAVLGSHQELLIDGMGDLR